MQQHTVVNGTDWAACYNLVTSNNNKTTQSKQQQQSKSSATSRVCRMPSTKVLSALDGKNRILE